MSPAEREIARQHARLLRVETNGLSEIVRSYQVVLKGLNRDLAALDEKIEAARAAHTRLGPSWLVRQARYQELIAQHERLILGFIHDSIEQIEGSKGSAIGLANVDAPKLASTMAGPAPAPAHAAISNSFSRLPEAQVDFLVRHAADGGSLGGLLAEIAPQATQAVKDALVSGVARGIGVRRMATEIHKASGIAQNRALTISRTEVIRAYRETSRTLYQRSDVVRGWTWFAQPDACPVCQAEQGSFHSLDEVMATHPACFPAGTAVSGPTPAGATKRWYDGDMLDIRFAGGGLLSVTPNHPILTSRGWVAAGALREGDDIIRCGGGEGDGTDEAPRHPRNGGGGGRRLVVDAPTLRHRRISLPTFEGCQGTTSTA